MCVQQKKQFDILLAMKKEGIPTGVWRDSILPFINDTKENLDGRFDYCIRVGGMGIICFGFGMTLRSGNREYFYQKLDKTFPVVSKNIRKTTDISMKWQV